jgi:hypothetical protein
VRVCVYGHECVEKFQRGREREREREREAFELEKPWVTREEMSPFFTLLFFPLWIGDQSVICGLHEFC